MRDAGFMNPKVRLPELRRKEQLADGTSQAWKSQNPTNSVSSPVLIKLIDDVASSKYFWVQNIRELLWRKLVFGKQLFKRAPNTEFWELYFCGTLGVALIKAR